MARIRKWKTDENSAAEQMIWYIALYIRLSKDDGSDESLSVTNQRKILKEYVTQFFQGEYILIDEYIDDGRTGTDYDRPEFQRMISDVETKKVNCVICKNLARAFRNYADQGLFLETFFPLHGTRFITLGDPKVDTYLNPEAVSGMEVPINGLMNDRFAAQTSSSVRRTFDNKRRNGEFIGAFAPYGYAKDPANKNALIIDEVAAQVVRDVFQWYVYGDGSSSESLSKEGIARKLNDMGVPNPSQYKIQQGFHYKNPHAKKNDGLWMGSSITRLLKNKVYIGTMVQGQQRVINYKVHHMIKTPEAEWYQVENTHEAIIPVALFKTAQTLQKRDIRTAPQKKEPYLFSGLLKCADCGKSMTRRGAAGLIYYNCSTYKRKSKDMCTIHSMRLDVLEKTVLTVIQKHMELMDALEDVIENIKDIPVARTKSNRFEQLLNLRKQELEKTSDLLSGLYMDWKNNDINRDQYRKIKEKLEKQEAERKQSLEYIKNEIATMKQESSSHDDPYLKAFLKHKNIQTLTQGVLVELIETIYIHEDDQITIQFKFENAYKPFEHK